MKKLILTAVSFGFIFGGASNIIVADIPGVNLCGANSRRVQNNTCVNAQSAT